MKEYFFLILAIGLMTFQLQFSKLYQLKAKTKKENLIFPFLTGAIAVILFLTINLFKTGFSTYSFLIAMIGSVLTTLFSLVSLKAIKEVTVGFYTAFAMLGALILPFIYGAIGLKEPVNLFMILGVIILTGALVYSAAEKGALKGKIKGLIYCMAIFSLNGVFGILSKAHQINENAVDTAVFLQWTTAFQALFALIIYIVRTVMDKSKDADTIASSDTLKINPKRAFTLIGISAGYSLCWGLGFFFQLLAYKKMAVSVASPIVTGAIIVLSGVVSLLLFNEKISKKQIVSYVLMIIGIILFIL